MTNRTARNRTASGSRRKLACAIALGAASLLGVAEKSASAQEWLKDRREQEGAGIRVGNLELHPGIGGEIGYDSNYFLRTYKEDTRFVNGATGPGDNAPVGTGILRITPSFTLSTLGTQRLEGGGAPAPPTVAFRAGISATYREFLSGDSGVRDQRNISGNAFARADILQGRPIGFGIFANYTRMIQPAVVSNPDLAFNHDDVSAGAEVIAIPGGGTFDIRAGYQFSGSFFEESNGVPFTNITHEISVRNRWKFRPRTALFHDTTLRFISYPNAERAVNYLDGSTPLRTRVGLTGLLSDRFGVLLAAGYGASFFKNPQLGSTSQYDSLNAQAEGTVYLSRADGGGEPGQATLLLSKFIFGYTRDFSNSLLSNYYTSNKGYARLEYFFTGRALITLEAYFEALSYPQPYYTAGADAPKAVRGLDGNPTGDFTNYHVGGTLYGEYRFTNSFGLTATIDYSQTISDVAIETGNPPTNDALVTSAYDLSWRRFQALLGARLFF